MAKSNTDFVLFVMFMFGIFVGIFPGIVLHAAFGETVEYALNADVDEQTQCVATEDQLDTIRLQSSDNELVRQGCSVERKQCYNYCIEESVHNAAD